MSKLRKLVALMGNISESDVDYIYTSYPSSNDIEVVLTNPDKRLHEEGQQWEGGYYVSSNQSDPDVIAFIQYSTVEKSDGKIELYVNYLEVRQEYRDTRALMYLLKEFEREVLNPTIEKYGKEKVLIGANFANEELGQMLERITKKMGIPLVDYGTGEDVSLNLDDNIEYEDLPDPQEDFKKIMEQRGLRVVDEQMVEGGLFEDYYDGLREHFEKLNADISYYENKFSGYIDNAGNVCYGTEKISNIIYRSPIVFEYEKDSNTIVFIKPLESVADYYKSHPQFIDAMNDIFDSPMAEFEIDNQFSNLSLSQLGYELKNYNQQNVSAKLKSRLKRAT